MTVRSKISGPVVSSEPNKPIIESKIDQPVISSSFAGLSFTTLRITEARDQRITEGGHVREI